MPRLTSLALGLVLALSACRTAPEVRPTPPPAATRLPTDVKPISESIELTIDPEKPTFSGVSKIDVELARETDRIRLHGRHLHVTSAKVNATIAQWSVVDDT